MNVKRALFAIVVGGLILAFSISRAVVDTSRIETVKGKNVLTPQDLQIIDDFMEDAVNDLVRTTSFTDVAKTRTIILNYQSPQGQYADQYSQSAYKRISEGLQAARGISDPAKRFKVMANLLILVHSLKDPRLADLAVGMIPHDNSTVRYWAVRAATDPGLWANSGESQFNAAPLATQIITECRQVVDTSAPEILSLMAEFAGRHDTARAEELLAGVADARMTRYADWTVTYELVDSVVLRQLCDKIAADGASNPQLAKRFGQLYSFVIQRYLKGRQQGSLKQASRNYLASVIADVEDKCLGQLLGLRQSAFTVALQQDNPDAVRAEHDKLLGAAGQPGTLVTRLSFTYGSADDSRTEPLTLSDPPQPPAEAEMPSQPQP